jgi:hypothetical protein
MACGFVFPGVDWEIGDACLIGVHGYDRKRSFEPDVQWIRAEGVFALLEDGTRLTWIGLGTGHRVGSAGQQTGQQEQHRKAHGSLL